MKGIIFIIVVAFSSFASAKKFATDYVSFDLLNNWHCHPEGTEWICTSKLNKKKASEAMIILTAKQKGPPDSLAQYINYLKSPRTIKNPKGGNFTSKVFHAKQRTINQHMWIDGFHHGSEVPVYYTRYLATVKGSLAVLVTYSAHKDHYKKYASDFAASINSLRVMNVSPDFKSKHGGSMGAGGAQDYLSDMINADDELGGDSTGGEGSGGIGGLLNWLKKPETVAGLGALAAILGYLVYRRIKRRRQKLLEQRENRRSSSRDRDGNRRRSRSGRSSSDRHRRSSSRSSSRRR